MKKLFIALAAAVSFDAAWGQSIEVPPPAPQELSPLAQREPDRSSPISAQPRLLLKAPELQENLLSNGLRLALVEVHRSPLVSLRLTLLGGGSAYDPKKKRGLAAITAALMWEGAGKKDGTAFVESLYDIGAQEVDIGAGVHVMDISMLITKDHLKDALQLVSSVVRSPRLPEKELERIKTERLSILNADKGNPHSLANIHFSRLIYPDHPYASLSTEETIKNITPKDVKRFPKAHFRPSHAVLQASGDVSLAELESAAKDSFGKWKDQRSMRLAFIAKLAAVAKKAFGRPADRDFVDLESVPVLQEPSSRNPEATAQRHPDGLIIEIIDQPGLRQSFVNAGHVSIRRDDPDFVPVLLMNQFLAGSNVYGRLYRSLRESKGWIYYVFSGFNLHKQAGFFLVQTNIDTNHTADGLKEILHEMSSLQSEPVKPEELEAVKQHLLGSFVLSRQTVQDMTRSTSDIEFYGLPRDIEEHYRELINAVTVEDIRRVAQKHLHPDQLKIVIIGDAAKIADSLSLFAPIKVYNTQDQLELFKKPRAN